MPTKPFEVRNVGEFGIVTDLHDYQLPPNAFSGGENVRFFENRAQSIGGYVDAFTPSIAPYFIDAVDDGTTLFYVYAGLDDIYTFDNSSHVERTRDAGSTVYTGNAADLWNGGVINGYHVLTNGADAPQAWQIGVGTDYVDLPYDSGSSWDDESWTCKILAPFKYSLLALDMNESGTDYPRRVRWPTAAVPGSLPADWDADDPTIRAGKADLVGGNGRLMLAKGMGESQIIYAEDTAFRADWVGGSYQYDFNSLDWSKGAITRRAVAQLPGGWHFVVSADDVYIHNSQQHETVIDERRRRALFESISEANYQLVFVVPYYKRNEAWICVPESGDTFCTRAHIWNWKRRTWSTRVIPNLIHGAPIIDPTASDSPTTWGTATDTWATVQGSWGDRSFNPMTRSLLMASPAGSGAIYRMDSSYQADGSNMYCAVERTGLNIGGGHGIATITAAYPRIKGGPVSIQVGGQMEPGGAVTWGKAVTFDPSTDSRVTFWGGASGRYNCYRIFSESNVFWEFEGILFEWHYRGDR